MLLAKLWSMEDWIVSWWFVSWTDPILWVALGVCLAGLTVMGTRPITAPRSDEAGLFTHLAVLIRQALVWGFVLTVVLVQVFVAIVGSHNLNAGKLIALMLERMAERGLYWWEVPASMWLGAAVLTFIGRRVIAVRWSALKRRFRLRQSGEELSDIRVEGGKLQPKTFLPSQHYRDGHMFFGLDSANKPLYVEDAAWRSMHMKIIGPTQTGKGVLLGVLADQAIRKGYCLIVMDPKPDDHLKDIMRQTAAECGRRFMELDLNDGSVHRWAPFAGGTERDRRTRLLSAFGLADTGEQADFYKAGERALLDQMLPSWSGDLHSLKNRIEHSNLAENMKRTLSYINEWLAVPTFSPQKGRGFSIERALRENAVVWVRGSLLDELVIKAATVFIMEVIQEGMRLYKNGRNSHLFFPIDEVRFMVSNTLANGLATVAGFRMNFAVSYQSNLDLLAIKDKQVNAKSVAESINVNCKLTICYQAANTETAEWASRLSGTIQKQVTRMETLKSGRFGSEEWEDDRTVARTEVPLISENTMRSLAPRVGVIFRPNCLAAPLYTGWVPVKPLTQIPAKLSENVATEAVHNLPSPPPPDDEDDGDEPPAPSRTPAPAGPAPEASKKKRRKRKAPPATQSLTSIGEDSEDATSTTPDTLHDSVTLDDIMVNAARHHHADDVEGTRGFDDVD